LWRTHFAPGAARRGGGGRLFCSAQRRLPHVLNEIIEGLTFQGAARRSKTKVKTGLMRPLLLSIVIHQRVDLRSNAHALLKLCSRNEERDCGVLLSLHEKARSNGAL
jgi:hypothetical protein